MENSRDIGSGKPLEKIPSKGQIDGKQPRIMKVEHSHKMPTQTGVSGGRQNYQVLIVVFRTNMAQDFPIYVRIKFWASVPI